MGSVPKPAYLKIILPNEERLARWPLDEDLLVFVWVKWRQAESVPSIFAIPSELPEGSHLRDFVELKRNDGTYTVVPKAWQQLRFGSGSTLYEAARKVGSDPGFRDYLEYANNVIKQYQPDFDYTASQEAANFLARTLRKIHKVVTSVEELGKHLQYSGPDKEKPTPPVADPDRDVKAAIMLDVMSVGSIKARKPLGLKRKWRKPQEHSTHPDIKREDATTRQAANRGRALLEHYFGAEEWREKVERMRKKRDEWLALEDRPKKQIYYLLAEHRGTSMENEENTALSDGFDGLLGEWIAAWDRDDRKAANKIEQKDPRLLEALDQY